jgi:putative transposase
MCWESRCSSLSGYLERCRSAGFFLPERLTSGEAFVAMDRILDCAENGSRYLAMPAIARVVMDAIVAGEGRFHGYELHSFVIMPNHVHLLVTPNVVATSWLGPLKGFTAREANKILSRNGHFWQDESYDHLVRSAEEFQRIQRYIENNPVKAGLAAKAEEFPWSSASRLQPGLAAPLSN